MENEIKAKVFAQYFGQQIISKNDFKGQLYKISTYKNNEEAPLVDLATEKIIITYDINDCKLILKPLSAITDEEREWFKQNDYVLANDCYSLYRWIEEKLQTGELQHLPFQYLQSRGYDLPNYLLGGKTLKEAGLAIYQNQ